MGMQLYEHVTGRKKKKKHCDDCLHLFGNDVFGLRSEEESLVKNGGANQSNRVLDWTPTYILI